MQSARPVWKDFETPFVPGRLQADTPQGALPLDRFLPPWHEGMASRWLNNYASPGSWVLDPFGQSPFSVLELAKAGYRVLVTANNPIAAFIIEVLASAPSFDEMQSTLRLLGESKSPSGLSLEEQIRSHYRIICPNPTCDSHNQSQVPASFEVERYIWQETQSHPSQAIGNCPICDFEGEVDIKTEVFADLPALPPAAMSRARALEKTAPPDDPLRAVMEEVINYYTDRALTLLQAMLSRIQNPSFTDRQRTLMQALFLSACDRGNQLWVYPLGRNRPRQLSRPPIFQEFNLWQALEEACHQWASQEKAITLRQWPQTLPQSGGICLFKGRLRELNPELDLDQINLIYANLPRRNQAWWNLSGLWSAWLWGKEGVKTLRNSLLKQRYDWTWHATALEKVLVRLNHMVRPNTPILLQVSEIDPLFVLASVKAAQYAGFILRSASCSGNVSILQSVWRFTPTQSGNANPATIRENAREIAKDFLSAWGEPASYPRLFSQIILGLQTQGLLFQNLNEQAQSPINKVQEDLDPVFTDSSVFHRFNPGANTDSGSYWLAYPPDRYTALADSVEALLRYAFLQSDTLNALEIATVVNKGHPGLMTPNHDLVQTILRSYANPTTSENEQVWVLKENENFATRNSDVKSLREIIEKIARQLAFKRQLSDDAIYFLDEDDNELYSFFVTSSAMVSEIVQRHRALRGKKLIVLPGSRANLISYKLRRDPSLQALMSDDWHFVKFRLLRNLHDNPLLTRDLFASQILSDPPEYQSSQLALF